MLCPYIITCRLVFSFPDHDYPVKVVRHHDKGVQFDVGKVLRYLLPTSTHDFTSCVQHDLVVRDPPEERSPPVRTQCDEVSPGPRVVESSQADRPTMVFSAIIRHWHPTRKPARVLFPASCPALSGPMCAGDSMACAPTAKGSSGSVRVLSGRPLSHCP